MSLLVAAFFIATLMKWDARPQQPGDSLGDHVVAGPAEPDVSAVHALSLGEAEQAERKRRYDETSRNKKRAEEDRKRKAADEERKALEQKQTEAAEQAVEQQAGADKVKKQKIAYEAIAKHESITLQDLPIAGEIGEGTPKQAVICRLEPDNLLELSFDLAVPSDTLSEGQPYEATVQPSSEQRVSWQISATPTRLIDKDSNAKPIPLATISVTDGQLVLKPARNEILGNQLFSLLRQSVLLVKARNPEQPDTAAGVVKAIQLVRPVAKEPFEVDLLSSSTKIDLNPPRGIFADTTAGKQEGFPRNAVVEYEIAYGFTLNGEPKQEVYSRKWTSSETMSFLPLLQCSETPKVPQSPLTVVGLSIAFGAGLSALKITPEVTGPDEHAFDLAKIRSIVRESDDEFQKGLNIQERQLGNKIRPFCGLVDDVNGKKLDAFIMLHERDLKSHFKPEAYAVWIKDCLQIHREATQVPRPGAVWRGPGMGLAVVTEAEFATSIASIRDRWQQVFVPRIQEWAADYAKRQQEQSTQMRKYFSCLRSPALVTVRRIGIAAVDKDGNKHPVILARTEPQESTQKETPPVTEASDSQPKL
jgi:hypothetical protein